MANKPTNARWGVFVVVGAISGTVPAACGMPPEDAEITTVQSALCSPDPTPIPWATLLWPGGVIPYEYSADPNDPDTTVPPGPESTVGTMQNRIRVAMTEWQNVTGNRITFQPSSSAPDRLKIVLHPKVTVGGTSPVGKYSRGGIADWGLDPPISHELGHIIGLGHEQKRFDRDRYVEVGYGCSSDDHRKSAQTDDDTVGFGEYDLSSTMQYNTNKNPSPGYAPPPYDVVQRNGAFITNGMLAPTAGDASAVLELYARELGPWKKFTPMGKDVNPLAPLDNSLASGVTIKLDTAPAVARDQGASTQFVFVRGTDGFIYWRSSDLTRNLITPWSTWTKVTAAGAVSSTSAPAASYSMTPTGIMIGELRSDGNIWIADKSGSTWTPWENISRPTGVNIGSGPSIATATMVGTYVFFRSTNDNVWYKRRVSGSGTSWGPWTSIAGSINKLRGTPAVVSRTALTLDVLASSEGGQLFQASFNGTTWPWSSVPNNACCIRTGTSPTVASSAPERMDVLFWDNQDRLSWKMFKSGAWDANKAIGGRLTASPAAVGYGGSRLSVLALGDHGALWHRRHVKRTRGDWDGDGRADYSLMGSDGSLHIRRSGSGAEMIKPLPANSVPVTADMDADGQMDVVYRRTSDSTWFVQTTTAGAPSFNTHWGTSGDIVAIGDYDGDGRDDFTVVRPPLFLWYIKPGNSTIPDNSASAGSWGTTNDIPVPGDYDGDGRDDKAVWRPSDGNWYVMPASTGVGRVWLQWGTSGDIPLPGDYDGDGKTDPAVFRPSSGTWLITRSSDGTTTSAVWAPSSGATFLPRDYDGDGRTDRAYFKASNHTWHVWSSYSDSEIVTSFGQSSDTPF